MSEPTVFVVDDDETVRQAMRSWVGAAGLRVTAFGTVDEFVDRYTPGQPGCLVFDVRSPGPPGSELLTKLTTKRVDIPVILVGGRAELPGAPDAAYAGGVDVVIKPCTEHLVLGRILQALERDALRREGHGPAFASGVSSFS